MNCFTVAWPFDPVAQVIRGVSHLKFDASGRVCWRRDYWDAAEEFYAKRPVIGGLIRWPPFDITGRQVCCYFAARHRARAHWQE